MRHKPTDRQNIIKGKQNKSMDRTKLYETKLNEPTDRTKAIGCLSSFKHLSILMMFSRLRWACAVLMINDRKS